MTLDFNKPIRTRDGREVRILCTDAVGLENGETIVAIVQGIAEPLMYFASGQYVMGVDWHRNDLVNYEPHYSRVMTLYQVMDGVINELVAHPTDVTLARAKIKLGDFRVTIMEGKLYNVELLCSTEKV